MDTRFLCTCRSPEARPYKATLLASRGGTFFSLASSLESNDLGRGLLLGLTPLPGGDGDAAAPLEEEEELLLLLLLLLLLVVLVVVVVVVVVGSGAFFVLGGDDGRFCVGRTTVNSLRDSEDSGLGWWEPAGDS